MTVGIALTDAQHQQIVRLAKDRAPSGKYKYTVREISEFTDLSPAAVSVAMVEGGARRRDRINHDVAVPPEWKAVYNKIRKHDGHEEAMRIIREHLAVVKRRERRVTSGGAAAALGT